MDKIGPGRRELNFTDGYVSLLVNHECDMAVVVARSDFDGNDAILVGPTNCVSVTS